MRKLASLMALFTYSVIAISQSYPSGNIVASYPFNGGTQDESGNGHHAQAYGVGLSEDRFGNLNSAYQFDGINDYIDTKTSFDFEERSISVWFKSYDNSFAGLYTDKMIFDQNAVSLTYGPIALWITDDTLAIRPARELEEELGHHYVPLSKWQHVVLICDQDSSWAYLNGTKIMSQLRGTSVGSTWGAYVNMVLGTDRSRTRRWYNGIIDDLWIYNRVLSEEEVQSIYQLGGWPLAANDLTVSWLSPDEPGCGTQFEVPVTIRIYNVGDSIVSGFTVSYRMNPDDEFVSEIVDTTVPVGDSLDYTFETLAELSGAGPFSCVAAIHLSGDASPFNDTIHILVENSSFEIVTETVPNQCRKEVGEANVVSVEGGLAPFSYFWTNGDTTAQADSLASGLYQVTVTDSKDCSSSASVLITETGGPQISEATTVTDISCHGGADGSIDVSIIGGVAPYTFEWSNGASTEDVSGLAPGAYELIVTSYDTCSNIVTFTVTEPPPLQYSVITTDADCKTDDDGTASIQVSGGVEPYTYLWSDGSTEANATGLSAGIHTVHFMDDNACSDSAQVSISETGSPSIYVEIVTPAMCGVASGGVTMWIEGDGNFEYLWSNGATTQDLLNVPPAEYSVQVALADSSCIANATFTVPSIKPEQLPICFVTVDSVAGRNRIVWSEATAGALQGFHIYRESSVSDVYQLTGWTAIGEEGTFIDSSANPAVKPWRYKISQMDTCGNESELSEIHQTIHLTMNVGLSGAVNLSWGNYKGIDYSSYHIYRYSTAAGREKIADVAGSPYIYYNTYTDLQPPADVEYYVVEIDAPECISTKKAGGTTAIKSNIVRLSNPTGVKHISANRQSVSLYPNPSSEEITLKMNLRSSQNIQFRIFDLQGKLIREWDKSFASGQQQETFFMTDNSSGMYYLQLIMVNEVIVKPFIIE